MKAISRARASFLIVLLLPLLSLVAGRSVSADTATAWSVEVKSEHLEGVLPNGVPVVIRLKVSLEGDTLTYLSGQGRHFASTGAHNYWPATGSLSGNTLTVWGVVTESNETFLSGSPVQVQADTATQEVTLDFGPLAGGLFVGKTLVFTGDGNVDISEE